MSSADLSACDIYSLVSPDWIGQRFPSGNPAFSRSTARDLARNREAWNFFELVESTDAATRLRICEAGAVPYSTKPVITPTLWYPLTTQGRQMLYRRGQLLHVQLCPNFNWTANRNRPIILDPPSCATPDFIAGPTQCPGTTGSGEGTRSMAMIEIEYGEAASQGASEVESLDTIG